MQIVVRTSNIPGAGTDANVYVDIRGSRGSSGRQWLRGKAINPFERGQVRGCFDVTSLRAPLVCADMLARSLRWCVEAAALATDLHWGS